MTTATSNQLHPEIPPAPLRQAIAEAMVRAIHGEWTAIALEASYADPSGCRIGMAVADPSGAVTDVFSPPTVDPLLDELHEHSRTWQEQPWEMVRVDVTGADEDGLQYNFHFTYPS